MLIGLIDSTVDNRSVRFEDLVPPICFFVDTNYSTQIGYAALTRRHSVSISLVKEIMKRVRIA